MVKAAAFAPGKQYDHGNHPRQTHERSEVLVHVSGPSSARDDARYYAQAQAYLHFEAKAVWSTSTSPGGRRPAAEHGAMGEVMQPSWFRAKEMSSRPVSPLHSSGVATVPVSSLDRDEEGRKQETTQDGKEGGISSHPGFEVAEELGAPEGHATHKGRSTISATDPDHHPASARLPQPVSSSANEPRSWDPSFTSQDARDMLSFAEKHMPETAEAAAGSAMRRADNRRELSSSLEPAPAEGDTREVAPENADGRVSQVDKESQEQQLKMDDHISCTEGAGSAKSKADASVNEAHDIMEKREAEPDAQADDAVEDSKLPEYREGDRAVSKSKNTSRHHKRARTQGRGS